MKSVTQARFCIIYSLLYCAGLLATGNPASGADQAPIPLFLDVPGEAPTLTIPASARARDPSLRAVERLRETRINPRAVDPTGLAVGDRLTLALFADVGVTATVDSIDTDINGVLAIRGRIDAPVPGHLLLSVARGRVLGSVSLPGRDEAYRIAYLGQGFDHVVEDLEPAAQDILEGGPSPTPPRPRTTRAGDPDKRSAAKAVQETSTLDVMIVYTPAARAWADNHANGIDSVISQAMLKGQLALDNSATHLQLRLVHSAPVDYVETDDPGRDLSRLTFHEGYDPWNMEGSTRYMDEIHDWRDTHGADLVALFALRSDTGGIAWLLNDPEGWPELGFAMVRVQQAHNSYTHIHEAGHNLGAGHHKEQTVQPGPGLHDYAAGWRWIGDDGIAYASVMTYESGQYFADGRTHRTVAYFANPAVLHQGVASGHVADGDNARTLREMGPVVAGYRAVAAPKAGSLIFSSGFE